MPVSIPRSEASPAARLTVVPGGQRNFGLTEPSFLELQLALKAGDHRLFERCFLAHFNDSVTYLRRNDKACYDSAYDAVMDTMLHFRDLIANEKVAYGNLRYLFTRMARQHYYRTNKRSAIFTDLPNESDHPLVEEDPVIPQEDFELLDRAFKSLAKPCRELLHSFYYKKYSLKDLAEQDERSPAAVRKQKSRCLESLRNKFNALR